MKIIKWLDEYLEEFLLTLLLIGISSVMIIQVISRYCFNYSLSWSDEISRYFLVWSGFLSVSFCVKKRISIKIEQVQNALPERAVPWLKMLRHTIVFLFCIIMIPYAFAYVQQTIANGSTSPALQIPLYYIQSAPLVCFVLLAIRVAQAWIREFRASRGIMMETIENELHPETLEEIKEKEAAEWAQRHGDETGDASDQKEVKE